MSQNTTKTCLLLQLSNNIYHLLITTFKDNKILTRTRESLLQREFIISNNTINSDTKLDQDRICGQMQIVSTEQTGESRSQEKFVIFHFLQKFKMAAQNCKS